MIKFLAHWKTTVAGILSAFLGTVPALTGFLAAYQTIQADLPGHSHADYRLAIWGAGISAAAAIARGWVGMIQHDAPPPPVSPPVSQADMKAIGIDVPTTAQVNAATPPAGS